MLGKVESSIGLQDKHIGLQGVLSSWIRGKREGVEPSMDPICWAVCHSFASMMDFIITSCSEKEVIANTTWLRAVHKFHQIQGYRGLHPKPVGGRHCLSFTRAKPSFVLERVGNWQKSWRGANFYTLWAKGQLNKMWVMVSKSLHRVQKGSIEMFRESSWAPTGRALLSAFQMRSLIFGEIFKDQISPIQLFVIWGTGGFYRIMFLATW